MENVIVTETRKGSPKYIIDDLDVSIRVELRKGGNSAQIRMKHKDILASNIYGREVTANVHEIYLKSLPREAYPIFCENLIVTIRLLTEQGLSIPEIAKDLYIKYQCNENIKEEVFNIQETFKKLNKEYKTKLEELTEISKEMDYICKQMEML